MDKDMIIAILEECLSVSDEWGGSKLAEWKWGFNVVVEGIDEAADTIIKAASQQINAADI